MNPANQLSEDLFRAFDTHDEVADAFDWPRGTLTETRRRMAILLNSPEDTGTLVDVLADRLGAYMAKRVLVRAGLEVPSPPQQPRELVCAWFRQRGVALAVVRTKPTRLHQQIVGLLRHRPGADGSGLLRQDAGARTYDNAKRIFPELERLFRLLAVFYLQCFPDETEQRGCILRAVAGGRGDAEPNISNDLTSALAALSLTDLALTLAELDRVTVPPYDSMSDGVVQLVDASEREGLRRIATLRNRLAHGGDEGDAREFCAAVRGLFAAWEARHAAGLIPLGAVVEGTEGAVGPALRCRDEAQNKARVFGVTAKFSRGDNVLLWPGESEHWGDRLRPLPSGGRWSTTGDVPS